MSIASPSLILSAVEAVAAYRAMCELNDVSGRLDANFRGKRVVEFANGVVMVTGYAKPSEDYTNQAEFAAAYGLAQ